MGTESAKEPVSYINYLINKFNSVSSVLILISVGFVETERIEFYWFSYGLLKISTFFAS